jgi:hypothetical protein
MKQEDKELMLKDLCARLPYKIMVKVNDTQGIMDEIDIPNERIFVSSLNPFLYGKTNASWFTVNGDKIYPYLRPMSSMTEEECDKVEEIIGNDCIFDFMSNGDIVLHNGHFTQKALSKLYDFYNSIHVDYHTDDEGRTMIEKGLAIKAPEGMYKTVL